MAVQSETPLQSTTPQSKTPLLDLVKTPADLPKPPGAGWVGCGNGFAAYGALGLARVNPEVHPSAVAVARLAAPRLAAGEGVDAAQATPVYVRDKVALTEVERAAR